MNWRISSGSHLRFVSYQAKMLSQVEETHWDCRNVQAALLQIELLFSVECFRDQNMLEICGRRLYSG
jgi:hypothetical protein